MSISSEVKRRTAIKTFIANWTGRGREKQDSQTFWLDLLESLYGVPVSQKYVQFEDTVDTGEATNFIDGYIPATKVVIEQKSFGRDLDKAYKQSNGDIKTPYQQAKSYDEDLPASKRARWIVISNFGEFHVYDMEKTGADRDKPTIIKLEELEEQPQLLKFLVDEQTTEIIRETELSIEAGELIGVLYDALKKEYPKPLSKDDEHDLNKLCVRLVFCYYADDADLFGEHLKFQRFIEDQNKLGPTQVRRGLLDLFRILNTPDDKRDKNDDSLVNTFSYVNGGLFGGEELHLPKFTDGIVKTLIKTGSHFDWATISPTIFGALFESTLNSETRRQGGMHYTSIQNIRKVTKPLFLDALLAEFDEIKKVPSDTERYLKLKAYRKKLGSLKFLDPACGSGNFLTLTYTDLRKLDNEALKLLPTSEQGEKISVEISSFYGIEINDFAVSVAKTAMWIAESQMQKKTEDILHQDIQFFPLTSSANIVEANALRIDWNDVVPASVLTYIMGNPPFSGARVMSAKQKEDVALIFGKNWKNKGNLDYVSCWFKKSADYMQGTNIKAALVATNSLVQGDAVAPLWKPLLGKEIFFDFAYRTFRWDSESLGMAHVHCVIIGFSTKPNDTPKTIFNEKGSPLEATSINGYLMDSLNIYVENREKPICPVPEIGIGNKPIDNGQYLFTKDEMLDFIKKEPKAKQYFRPWNGAEEFIRGKSRYCLFVRNANPSELKQLPLTLKRIENVKNFRLKSPAEGTRKLAEYPRNFHIENFPTSEYLCIPSTSSERRKYVPMAFLPPEVLSSNAVLIVPDNNIYQFGVLTSVVHMAWLRTIGGRLKSDYRYSAGIVYNGYPWPTPKEDQKKKIENTATKILEVRKKYPNSSLGDLYDPNLMPADLLKAHKDNDKAVMEAYGFNSSLTESEIVANLFKLYQEKIDELELKEEEDKAKALADAEAKKAEAKAKRAEEVAKRRADAKAKRDEAKAKKRAEAKAKKEADKTEKALNPKKTDSEPST